MVRAIREKVRSNYSGDGAGGVSLADLIPAIQARDAVEGKVAAIGTVNPRPPGLLNDLAQSGKRAVARALDWHVREQVEFNRAVLSAIDTLIEAHNETNRAIAALGSRVAASENNLPAEWDKWKAEWEKRLVANEVKLLRGVADLQAAFQLRTAQMESGLREAFAETRRNVEGTASSQREQIQDQQRALQATYEERERRIEVSFRETVQAQHEAFTSALARSSAEIQAALGSQLEAIRHSDQAGIQNELRLIRQRSATAPVQGSAQAHEDDWPPVDWLLFAEKFRGKEDSIRKSFERYVPVFAGAADVLDLGCGRGEFLELMKRASISARGVDLSAANVGVCHCKDLDAERADMFEYLESLPDHSLGGVFCAQVIEHLPPPQVPKLVALCARKLRRNSPIVFETPNPECLAIFATHFYIDPTHVKPLPPSLMWFYLEEAGFGQIEIQRLAPAGDAWPELNDLPPQFRERFFGFLDYAISARSLS